MTEPKPNDITTHEAKKEPKPQGDLLIAYLWRKRELLIAELREVDRLLGRMQTIPERVR